MPLRKNTPMSTYIKDFEKSDAPQFKGKSKEKRREMAIAAKLQASGKKKMDEMDSNDHISEKKGTLCGRCGHVHVKGTPCPRPFKESFRPDYPDLDNDKNTAEPIKKAAKDAKMKKETVSKVLKKLKEIDSDKTRGTVTIKKATPPADIKKLTDQGVDVELVPESLDFFERTLDDDTYVDVSGPSVEMTMEELLGDFAERLKDIPEQDRKEALNAIKTFWIRMIREWNPNLIVPGRASVTEGKKPLVENHNFDYEGQMAKAQLISIIKNAKSLYDSIDDRTQLKSWVQSKLTKAEDYIDGVRTYLDGEAVSSTAPLMHGGELVHDDEGTMLKIGDVVKGADGRIYQAAYSYSDAKPFLTPFDLKNRKPINLRERHYFDTVNEGDMSPTKKMVKVMEYSATRGGFVR